ncbi:MAG TPA: gluconate 2-dehydrogenase subunit 3 family protein, partial [Blastocatellia bacterium]|nr:gluconate 2-dehydrogenase subunit 3 family protein [Blastocatellia bacterium]
MAEEKDDITTRREALKGIGLGIGVIASLPVLGSNASAQTAAHDHASHAAQAKPSAPEPLKFFTPEENATVIEMSERIIPADDSSPGAKAARVSEYIDLIVSESSDLTKQAWRDGLAAVDKKSRDMFGKAYASATADQQVQLLKEISKNEKSPQTIEERFFRTIK